ncbi:hypothetical protein [Candidatus Symbiopectobacterium sp. NZEC135]|uniref:hypothetical protein n=1 Tax=Candidatus Symbiopectobacterium sp. NZEC135 TaxID=2820471 RepID=UPI0022262143|nr:hypothetical protein [Candidatus Symbiopectobacterium sp. NZEC135]MCW2482828.1 hypothetical protein [Candidatus Symbiopectobacterium sp. NZEC135]
MNDQSARRYIKPGAVQKSGCFVAGNRLHDEIENGIGRASSVDASIRVIELITPPAHF